MAKKRIPTWLMLGVLAIGVLVAAFLGLWAYAVATATPIHPNPQDVPSVTRSEPPPQWSGSVDRGRQIVRTGISEQNLPGISVAVGVGGDLVWAEGFGWADLESHAKVAPETRFRTGGVSMALTSAAVGLLLEQDRLKLDDEIQKYVPAFPKKQWPVTLRQLMAHVAGVSGDSGDEESMEHCDRTADGLQRFANRPLRFEPGTQHRYSTYGWIAVSAAVETAADEPFFTFMRRQVFEPLGMAGTAPDASTAPTHDRATFYHPRMAGDTRYGPEPAREGDYSCFAGGGAFLSTSSDLVRFAMAFNGGTFLQPATVQRLQTMQRLTSGAETGYALGWDLETVSLADAPTPVVGHDSEFTTGGSVSLFTWRERGIVVAVMTNTAFGDTQSLAVRIAEAFGAR